MKKEAPRSLAELRQSLTTIFPLLPRDIGTSGESVFAEAGPTYDSLLREFLSFFENNMDQFPDRQLRRFAELVAACLASPGPLADAMDTCFLAHVPAGHRFNAFLAAAREGDRK